MNSPKFRGVSAAFFRHHREPPEMPYFPHFFMNSYKIRGLISRFLSKNFFLFTYTLLTNHIWFHPYIFSYTNLQHNLRGIWALHNFSKQRKCLGFSKWTKINVQKSFSVGKNLQKNPRFSILPDNAVKHVFFLINTTA